MTRKHDQLALGRTRLTAASRARSAGSKLGSWSLAAEHGELMAEDKDLKVLGGIAAGQLGEELDGAAQRQVRKSWQHRVASAVGAAEAPQ